MTCPATDAHFLAGPQLKADSTKSVWQALTIAQGHCAELQMPLVGPGILPQACWLPCIQSAKLMGSRCRSRSGAHCMGTGQRIQTLHIMSVDSSIREAAVQGFNSLCKQHGQHSAATQYICCSCWQ